MTIFGVSFPTCSKQEIYSQLEAALKNTSHVQVISTLNPEILLLAEKDQSYRKILNQAEIKVIDGFGITLLAWLKGKRVGERLTGADLAEYILQQAATQNKKICCVMRADGLSKEEEMKTYFQNNYPTLNYSVISLSQSYYPSDLQDIPTDTEILMVGLGAPYQEQLIQTVRSNLPQLRIAIGVGGTFDYWTGQKKRAPKLLQNIGLEWLWRLVIQPNRLIRILRATFVFSTKSLFFNKQP